MKYGFELEAFILDKKKNLVLVPSGLPHDECGWLVEVRSEPHADIRKALYLLLAEKEAVEASAKKMGYTLSFKPLMTVPRELKVEAARLHSKGVLRYRNIYGHQTHKCSTDLATASLHISITNEREVKYGAGTKHNPYNAVRYQDFIDYAQLIYQMDKAFKKEIEKAKRNPGFYEVKYDGRIEYRSLPNNVDLKKVREVLMNTCLSKPLF